MFTPTPEAKLAVERAHFDEPPAGLSAAEKDAWEADHAIAAFVEAEGLEVERMDRVGKVWSEMIPEQRLVGPWRKRDS